MDTARTHRADAAARADERELDVAVAVPIVAGTGRGVPGPGRRVATIVTDPDRSVPPYEQVRRQIADLIGDGALATGERLPPVRRLAAELGLATGTVARAYRELEAAGLIETRRGGGTLVAGAAALTPAGRRRLLAEQADAYAAAARRLAVAPDEALEAIRTALGGA